MKRRKFLGMLSLGAAGTAVGVATLPGFNKLVKRIIENDTKELNVADGAIDQYLMDAHERKVFDKYNFAKKEFIRIHYFLDFPLLPIPYRSKYTQYRSEIVGHFLLSTNFFFNKMDTNKVIKYESIYDPYFRPCSHPFSNLFYS